MQDNGYIVLDMKAFDKFLSNKDSLIASYNSINDEYDKIVDDLMENWKGSGALAFKRDALTVRSNITGIFDILKIMCDTLVDCKAVFSECDSALGEYNRNPDEK